PASERDALSGRRRERHDTPLEFRSSLAECAYAYDTRPGRLQSQSRWKLLFERRASSHQHQNLTLHIMTDHILPLASLPSHSPLGQTLEQPLLLGLFLPIHNGGWTMSTLPRGTDWTFDYNAALTKQAEQLGFDLAFGPAHWLSKGGFGGETKYREQSLDAFIA